MAVTTKMDCAGIVRDSSPMTADSVSGVRQALGCVVRAPGVIESRPNFDLLYEEAPGKYNAMQVRALREFRGYLLALLEDVIAGGWSLLDASTGDYLTPAFAASGYVYEPVDYDASEAKFAESRGNLYMTALRGTVVVESPLPAVAATTRTAGVEMWCLTDWRGPDTYGVFDPGPLFGVVGYRFVFVRKDGNDYTRRSPPSQIIVTTCTASSGGWASGTRCYFPISGTWQLEAGDQVEFYRSLAVAAPGPIAPEFFLSQTYTLTSADIAAGYFAPPTDATPEGDLGAALYTNATQSGAVSAKYIPPQAQAIAWWQHVMWYGRTASKQRSPLATLKHLYRAGRAVCVYSATFTSGSPAVAINGGADTSDIVYGMRLMDVPATAPEQIDPRVAGAYVPADATVTAVGGAGITMSANAIASGTVSLAFFPATLPAQGIIAEHALGGSYTSGSPDVTGLASTDGWAAGMYWTDATHGPTVAGTYVPAGTKILSILSSTSVRLTANALSTGTADARVGDCVTVGYASGYLELYAWIAFTTGALQDSTADAETNHYVSAPWSAAWTRCFAIHTPTDGTIAADTIHTVCDDFGYESAIATLTNWINWSSLTTHVVAIPDGTIPERDPLSRAATNGTLLHEVTPNSARGIVLEELGLGATAAFSLDCTCPSAFSPSTQIKTTNDDAPHRLYWSDPDEPESVPLLNYTQIGSQTEPIYAVIPLRSALLVFKKDGVWRISGSAPSSWQVDSLDPTLRLMRPESIATMNNCAYAWCSSGFFEVTEAGSRSLSAGRIDVELRDAVDAILGSSATHGEFVTTWQTRQLVMLGVPSAEGAEYSTKIYVWCATTNAWTQWDEEWVTACASERDTMSIALAPTSLDSLEIRQGIPPRGYDREYSIVVDTYAAGAVTISDTNTGKWTPAVGDFVCLTQAGTLYARRITAIDYSAPTYTLTLEAPLDDVDGEIVTDSGALFVTDSGAYFSAGASAAVWTARQAAVITVEWHPASSAGVPLGTLARESQMQMDLRDMPDQTVTQSIPRYEIGGSSDRLATPVLIVNNAARTGATVQPLRTGFSRQIARHALLAPMIKTSDVFALRCVGASMVFEGFSEKTRR